MHLDLDPQLFERLLNYLATRPWMEVQGLMPPLLEQVEANREAQEQAHAGAGDAHGARVVAMPHPNLETGS